MTRRLVKLSEHAHAVAREEARRLGIPLKDAILAALRTGHHRERHPHVVSTHMDPASLAGRIRSAESERAPLRYAAHEQLEANQRLCILLPGATGEAVTARERAHAAGLDIEPGFPLPHPRIEAWMQRYLFRKPADAPAEEHSTRTRSP